MTPQTPHVLIWHFVSLGDKRYSVQIATISLQHCSQLSLSELQFYTSNTIYEMLELMKVT